MADWERVFKKGPTEAKEYAIDCTDWLGDGVSIASAAWTLPPGVTKDGQRETATFAFVTISAGTLGTRYKIEGLITTDEATPQSVVGGFYLDIAEPVP